MPTVFYPPSVDQARQSMPQQAPRLQAWFETPVTLAGLLLPLVPPAVLMASLRDQGAMGLLAMLVPLGMVAAVASQVMDLSGPRKRKTSGTSLLDGAVRWLRGRWHRPAVLGGLLALPSLGYAQAGTGVWNWLSAVTHIGSRQEALALAWQGPVVAYAMAIAAAAVWGLSRQDHYNRTFRNEFREYQGQSNSEHARRSYLWEAVRSLPRLDFDGRRATHGEPTDTALLMQRTLQARGLQAADAPGGPNDAPRLILEYELVGLRRGFRNYRADLAIVCPARNLKIDIELDGGYHGRQRQQIRDDKRNRTFLSRGWTVIRFDNEEVHRNPERCADEVEQVMATLLTVPLINLSEVG